MQQQIRCQGHIINLTIFAFLFKDIINIKQIKLYKEDKENREEFSKKEKKEKQDIFWYIGILNKLYNIIVYIHSSAVYMKLFKSYTGRKIPFDNRT